ncbi:M24 family metallopeptidase [Microbacterium sp. NPDC058342]|uniref:M24 family metallopeptidase n=1 Tax=Microbacterium sp. NPDC058342 TaxID=3346454 RepID=UPI00364D9095
MYYTMYFPLDEYHERWARVEAEMVRRGFQHAIVWGRGAGTYEAHGDLLYLTNFYSVNTGATFMPSSGMTGTGFAAALLSVGQPPELIIDTNYYSEEFLATDRIVYQERQVEYNIPALVAATLNARVPGERVAMVGESVLPVMYARIVERLCPGIEFVEQDDLVLAVRLHKSARELDCYREAGQIATAAMTKQLEAARKPGTKQTEVAAAGIAELIRLGGVQHAAPVSSGNGDSRLGEDPLTGSARDIEIRDGDLVRTWLYGPMWQGYWLDPGRTIVAGRSSARQREAISAVNGLVQTMFETFRPGTTLSEIATVASTLRDDIGFGTDFEFIPPVAGHGLGLYWEPPNLWATTQLLEDSLNKGDEALWEGQVISVEYFLKVDGVGSIGVEQNLIVHADGNELLTPIDLEWW